MGYLIHSLHDGSIHADMEKPYSHSTLTFSLQALLARHEAYMADAERDRLDLTARIERLELNKQELEAQNANKIEENRNLLDQLEMINNTVTDSDIKIRTLEASLLSSQQAVRRLESAAARAEGLEHHLAMLEEEQEKLHSEIRMSREDARSHAHRFKEAQRGILDMQDQLERMETEAQQERDRHAEVVGRMERQRDMEKQLDTAAGRLKGAAATKSLAEPKNGSKVVSHFVRDLLQDNANLQLGIAELREMLFNSNDEIQSLREQLMYHQPVPQDQLSAQSTLKDELEPQVEELPRHSANLSQELHIHHHYHVPKQGKSRKKRHSLNPGIFAPSALHLAGPNSGHWGITSSPSAPALIGDRDRHVSSPLAERNNWASNPPSEFNSSVPSSPRSNRVSSLFDSNIYDSPSSPTTTLDPMSPAWRASHHKRPSAASFQSFQNIPHLELAAETAPQRNYFGSTIHEEDEDAPQDDDTPGLAGNESSTEQSTTEDSEFSKDDYMPRPRLHRAHSHESIMSLTGGLDIHTLKSRPSQMTLRPLGGLEAIVTGVVAEPTISRATTKRSDAALRDHFSGFRSGSETPRARSPAPSGSGIGKWVPNWRPWGASNPNIPKVPTPTDPPKPSPSKRPDTALKLSREKDASRPPGINQSGSIPGFQQYWSAQKRKGAPARVSADTVDTAALSEGLLE